MKIILASASPRRRELLQYICPEYLVEPADIDETVPLGTKPHEAGEYTARRKAAHVSASHPEDLVIGADTIVVVDGRTLGKPADRQDGTRMLELLSGREHFVYTGVALCLNGEERSFTQCTKVWFYPLSSREIQAYLDTGEPFDKAGAYGIQGFGSALVEKIEGDFFNVMGLPVARLKREMEALAESAGAAKGR